MTTAASTSPISGAGLWQSLFRRADSDGSQTLSLDELAGLTSGGSGADAAQAILAARDANQDGVIGVDEMPSTLSSVMPAQGLLGAQSYGQMSQQERQAADEAALDALFGRADLDGNGRLSADELAAERALNRAAWEDAGQPRRDHAFLLKSVPAGAEIGRDDIAVGYDLGPLDGMAVEAGDDPGLAAIVAPPAEAEVPPDAGAPDEPADTEAPDPLDVLADAIERNVFHAALLSRLLRDLETMPAGTRADVEA